MLLIFRWIAHYDVETWAGAGVRSNKSKSEVFFKQIFLKYFQEMIKAADLDRDGKISWDEFKKFMQSPNWKLYIWYLHIYTWNIYAIPKLKMEFPNWCFMIEHFESKNLASFEKNPFVFNTFVMWNIERSMFNRI